MHRNTFIAIGLLILAFMRPASGADNYHERTVLFPGESQEIKGIKLEWRVNENDRNPESGNPFYPGHLVVTGPASGEAVFPIVDVTVQKKDDGSLEFRETTIFMDGMRFRTREPRLVDGKLSLFAVDADSVGTHQELTPDSSRNALWVSFWTPVTIGNYRLSYSHEKKTLVDGSQYYMLKVDNDADNIHDEIPITPGSKRKIGRLYFDLRPDDVGKTVQINYEADQLVEVTGRYALIMDWDFEARFGGGYIPIKAFFDHLSERYGFTIEWKDQNGFSGSAEEVRGYNVWVQKRNLQRRANQEPNYGTVGDIIKSINDQENQVWVPNLTHLKLIDFAWESPTTLYAYATNMEELAARRKTRQELEQENEKNKELFDSEYQLTTKAYPVTSITAETALDLIKPDLKTWYLKKQHEGFEVFISSIDNLPHATNLNSRAESALVAADRRAVILTAIQKNHDLFAERLANINKALGAAPRTAAGRPHQLIVTLLVGSQDAKTAYEASEISDLGKITWDPGLAKKFGLSAEDLDAFGIKSLGRAGAGMVSLLPEKGASGRASVALGPVYSAELEFEDMREPYLVLRGRLIQQLAAEIQQTTSSPSGTEGSGGMMMGMASPFGDPTMGEGTSGQSAKSAQRILMQNSLYLQPGQAEMLGVTNLREALILVVEWKAEKQ